MSLTERLEQLAAQQAAEKTARAWNVYHESVRVLAAGGNLTDADVLAAADAAQVVGRELGMVEADAAALAELPVLRQQVSDLPDAEEQAAAKVALTEKLGVLHGELWTADNRPPGAPRTGRPRTEIMTDIERLTYDHDRQRMAETNLRLRLREVEKRLKAINLPGA